MKSLILLLCLFLKIFSFSEELNSQEKNWIKENSKKEIPVNYIRIANEDVFAYMGKESGNVEGVYRDFFDEVSKKTDLKFQINIVSRKEVLEQIKKEDNSIYLKLSQNSEREKHFNFGNIFDSFEIVMIGNSEIETDFDRNLSGKKIGILPRTSEENCFRKAYAYEKYIPIEVSSIEEGFKKLYSGEIDYFIGKSEYLRATDKYVASLSKIDKEYFSFAVRKNYPELFSIIEKETKQYSGEKLIKSIRSHRVKYFKEAIKDDPDHDAVKKRYHSLKVMLSEEKYYMPFYYYSKGEYYGYIPEFYRSIGKILDLPVQFIRREDSIKNPEDYHIKAMDIKLFKGQWDFHKFYRGNVAIVGRQESDYILEKHELKNYKVAVKKSDLIKSENSVETDSYEKSIQDVAKGKIDYLVGDFRVLSSLMSNFHLGNKIKIAGYFPAEFYITSTINEGNEELSRLMVKIGKPFLGERHVLENDLKKSTIISPDYGKTLFFITVTLGISLFFFFHIKKMKVEEIKRERMMNSLIESFEMANYYSDEDTGHHILRINRYAGFLAEKFGCSRSFVKNISKYSSLHDIGKIGISENILKKPEKLTTEEREEIKKHVEIGYNLTRKMNAGIMAENIARYHHERWDGQGYLSGLKGKKIPLEARIVALVDIYDALRQKRIYKEGFSHVKSVEIIREESGKALDPQLVKLFLKYNREFDEIYNSEIR